MPGLTIHEMRARKGQDQLIYVQVTSAEQAAAAEQAGVDMIGGPYDSGTLDITAAAPNMHYKAGLPYGQYASAEIITDAAFRAMAAGAGSVYTAQSLDFVSAMAAQGIPVFGHIGLVPPLATWAGGFRAVGKTSEQAVEMFRQAKRYEDAGAVGVEIEVVPHRIATEISRRSSLVMISMGAGSGCDVQYLFSADLLGENSGHVPRHAKVYRDFEAEYARLQAERIAAYREFAEDVRSGRFPEERHTVGITDDEFDRFQEEIDKLS